MTLRAPVVAVRRVPAGHGVSYGYDYRTDRDVRVDVTVANTGKVAGETVVQLYLQDVSASMSRPVKELKNFQKLMLKPGESRTLTFRISEEDLKFYNGQLQRVAEPGEFNVQIGLDSQAVQQQSFELL